MKYTMPTTHDESETNPTGLQLMTAIIPKTTTLMHGSHKTSNPSDDGCAEYGANDELHMFCTNMSHCTDAIDPGSHKTWRPAVAEVQEYARRREWI